MRARELLQAGNRKRTVLVDERDDVGDGGQRDEVEVPLERIVRERLKELERDAGPAELRKRVRRGPRSDDRAVRQLVSGPVVVGDDDLQAKSPGGRHLLDGGDAAVDGEHEPVAVLGELLQGLAREPVALLETARQVPADIGSELPEAADGEHRRADAVHVVVAVDADAGPVGDRLVDELARTFHISEQVRVVAGRLAGQERRRRSSVVVAAADQHAGSDLGDAELLGERPSGTRVAGSKHPVHVFEGTALAGRRR